MVTGDAELLSVSGRIDPQFPAPDVFAGMIAKAGFSRV
jgi:hypothetical protein